MSTGAKLDRALLVALGLSPESAALVMEEIESLRLEIEHLQHEVGAHEAGIEMLKRVRIIKL